VKVKGVKVWESRTFIYTREESLTIGAQASDQLEDGEDAMDVIGALFAEITSPSLKEQIRSLSRSDKLFRVARRADRPAIIKRYERTIERDNKVK